MKTRIYTLILFNHIASFYALWHYSLLENIHYVLLGWILFGKIGGEIGFHRYLSHKSFKTGIIRHYILILLGCMNCFGSPVGWTIIHRTHHLYSDTNKDPHGGDLPWWKVWFTLWRTSSLNPKLIIDLIKEPGVKKIHDNYFRIVILTILSLSAFVSIKFTLFFVCVPAVIIFHSAGMVNTICHRFGYHSHKTKDKSYNNLFVNFLTLGSGLHNNHHFDPNNPFCSEKWYEIDIHGFFIRYFFKQEHL